MKQAQDDTTRTAIPWSVVQNDHKGCNSELRPLTIESGNAGLIGHLFPRGTFIGAGIFSCLRREGGCSDVTNVSHDGRI